MMLEQPIKLVVAPTKITTAGPPEFSLISTVLGLGNGTSVRHSTSRSVGQPMRKVLVSEQIVVRLSVTSAPQGGVPTTERVSTIWQPLKAVGMRNEPEKLAE